MVSNHYHNVFPFLYSIFGRQYCPDERNERWSSALSLLKIMPLNEHVACTSVVTEIAYHAAPTIDADVSFLSEVEWRKELVILRDDLVDQDGDLKRITNLRSDAGIAWHKVSWEEPLVYWYLMNTDQCCISIYYSGAARSYDSRPNFGLRSKYVFVTWLLG